MTRRPMRPNPLMPTRIFSPCSEAGRTSESALTMGSLAARVVVETRAVHLWMAFWGSWLSALSQTPGRNG